MILFPAIDLKNGQCVRLTQGDFAQATIYEADPLRQAHCFQTMGASWLHMVDLDGAKTGSMQQFDVISHVTQNTTLHVQVGGGICETSIIEKLLKCGVHRVVIGSVAVKNKALVREWLQHFGSDVIVLALDIRLTADNTPEILTHGWQKGSQLSLWELGEHYMECGLKTILCTDVSRDGMLTGTNRSLYQLVQKRWPQLDILASGGVKDLEDLVHLAGLGLKGAIIGKALYEGHIDLAKALLQVSNVS